MISRFSFVFWSVVVVAAIGLYYAKFRVQELREEVIEVTAKLKEEREALHVISAEWTYLTRPERLQALNRKHLNLVPLTGEQIGDIATLPTPVETGGVSPASMVVASPEGSANE